MLSKGVKMGRLFDFEKVMNKTYDGTHVWCVNEKDDEIHFAWSMGVQDFQSELKAGESLSPEKWLSVCDPDVIGGGKVEEAYGIWRKSCRKNNVSVSMLLIIPESISSWIL